MKTLPFIIVLCIAEVQNNELPSVDTQLGKIVGKYAFSYNGRRYAEYLSIPYAKPPVGQLRFTEPQSIEPWIGIWQISRCINLESLDFLIAGQEDCLYLSVFVPEVKKNKDVHLNVFLDIHGGGFNFGSSTDYTGPEHLMDKDIIFVKMNYRLGVLGFLSTEDEVVPGNNGLKDQVEAIKWTKNNIKYFGGNPESIVLTGLSAGGASVHFHYLSPLSKGLFKAGISISGNALCPWAMQENALKRTLKLSLAMGCTQKFTYEIVNCLRQRPLYQIIESIRMFRPWLFNPFSVFGVVVEKHGTQPFLPEHPYKLFENGKVQNLPWLTSTVKHEGLYPLADLMDDESRFAVLEERWNELAPLIFHYDESVSQELLSNVSIKIKTYYLKNEPASKMNFEKLVQMAGDRLFYVDTDKSIRLQAKTNKAPTYYYHFTYEPEDAFSIIYLFTSLAKRQGVAHGDDILLIFHIPNLPLKKFTKADEQMKNILLDIWMSFSKEGVPKVKNVKWDPVSRNTKDNINYLHLKSPNDISFKQIEEIGRRSFWDTLPFQENEQLFKKNTLKEEL
ncbi:hypothetical protein FQA39_LY08283 [Lamprigera yunnana]|nr:hypothetical protein FQA39_LY08283 [Lamprigera yunnana]